jgi:mannose-6-phosphate isomerase-like protein (cupin superfamily)
VASETHAVAKGDGFAVGNLDSIGDGPGFRKVRRELDVAELGVNALVLPPGFAGPFHFHDEQEELYFVHQGTAEFEFGDGSKHVLGAGGLARVDAPTHRRITNLGDTDLVLLVAGAKGGYVGRDGRMPEGEDLPARPGDSA